MMSIQYPSKNYTVWDLETSGLDPKKDKIIEIGWVDVRDGQITNEGSILVNQPGLVLSELITNLTGITTEMLAEGEDPSDAYDFLIHKLIVPRQAHVTHNGLRFDLDFVLEAIFKESTIGVWEERKQAAYANAIDTAVLYKALMLQRRQRFGETFAEWGKRVMDERVQGLKYNVGVCCDELGIDKSKVTQHRALGDVQLTHEIYKKLVERHA